MLVEELLHRHQLRVLAALPLGLGGGGLELSRSIDVIGDAVIQAAIDLTELEDVLDGLQSLDAKGLELVHVLEDDGTGLLYGDCGSSMSTLILSWARFILTLLEILGYSLSGPRLADALDQSAIVLGRLKQHAVDEVAVVVADTDHGLLLVPAEARLDVVDDTIVAGDGGKAAKDRGEVGDEQVLHVHAGTDIDDALEGLGLGVLDDTMFLCGL